MNDSASVALKPAPWWGRISLLWLMLVPVCAVLYTLCLPIAPNDFWYHVRAGWAIATTGQVPTTNLFSSSPPWVTPQTPYYYQSWIAELVMYKTLQSTGLAGITLLRSLCIGFTFIVLVYLAYSRSRRLLLSSIGTAPAASDLEDSSLARTTALSALFAFGLAAANMDIRPQTFSVPLFILFIAALFAWPTLTPRKQLFLLLTLPLAMLLWANTHGAFVTGLIVLVVYCCGETVHTLAVKRWPALRQYFGLPLEIRAHRNLGILCLLCLLAPLLNPRGYEVYLYVMRLAGNEASQRYIQEWKPPTLDEWYSVLFFLSLLALLFVLIWLVRLSTKPGAPQEPLAGRVRLAELLALGALMVMSLRDIRSIIWYALAFAPIFSACCIQLVLLRRQVQHDTATEAARLREKKPDDPITYYLNAFISVFLLLLIVPLLPWMKYEIPWPPDYRARFAPTPAGTFPPGFTGDPPLMLERETPVEAVAYLRRSRPQGLLYNDMVFGSYLTWALHPDVLPSSDPRVELYPLAFWEDYERLSAGPADAPRILMERGFSDALLHHKRQAGLVKRLRSAPGWKQIPLRGGPAVLLRYQPGAS